MTLGVWVGIEKVIGFALEGSLVRNTALTLPASGIWLLSADANISFLTMFIS